MLNCSDPCDDCKPKDRKLNCDISCNKNSQYIESSCDQCGCNQYHKGIKCNLVCEKKDPGCPCKTKEKISCKISCEKEPKPKKCENCGRLIF